MKKLTSPNRQQIKEVSERLKNLQAQLVLANKAAGIDDYVDVVRQKTQARFERVRKNEEPDSGIGHFLIQLEITAKKESVCIPLSIASGKKQTGFIYQIEGTAAGTVKSAAVTVSGDGVTQVTLGTITYAKIPAGGVASFRVQAEIRGQIARVYTLRIHQINYKLAVTDTRYRNYIKVIPSKSLTFS